VEAAVSRGLPDFIRDEGISEMVADVPEGYLDLSDARAAARDYVNDHHREAGTWSDRSLDAPKGHSDDRTLHELIGA